jgi:hypothetical protein
MDGLVLAGAWTDTGWPATMEGAVRSGHAAAHEALIARLPEAAEPVERPLVAALNGHGANGHRQNGNSPNGHPQKDRTGAEIAVEGRP